MIAVEFIRVVHLPRFTMKVGDTWSLRPDRIGTDGSFTLGNGTVQTDEYKIIRRQP